MKQIIVIPARMKGTRLPGKPLMKILDKTIIWHVWDRCQQVHPSEKIFVATEDIEIKNYCEESGINCVVTGLANTAIDRVKLFSDTIVADSYINVQGDEPLINQNDILSILKYNREYPDRVVFGKSPANEQEFNDISKAKVVCDLKGNALYFSREPIPTRSRTNDVPMGKQICVIPFQRNFLLQYTEMAPTPLEIAESIDMMRVLENGYNVKMVYCQRDSYSVDTIEDLKKVEKLMAL